MTLGPIGAPFAALYGAGVMLRRVAYDRGWLQSSTAPLRLVSVGGLEAGGSGKTPVAKLLIAAFLNAGQKVALLTRGYGRSTRGLVVRRRGEEPNPALIGDEPAMIARALDVPVAAAERRADGAEALAKQGCSVAVMDDAFSHRAQRRDLDIVVLRGEAPFGNGHLLPWGSLREPVSSLSRAGVIWLHFRNSAKLDRPRWWGRWCNDETKLVVSESALGEVVDLEGRGVDLGGKRVVAVCGIARPDDFLQTLTATGCEVVGEHFFGDHFRYTQHEVARLQGACVQTGAEAVVTTAKDAIKLRSLWQEMPLWVLNHCVRLCSGQNDLSQLLDISADCLEEPVG